MKKIKDLFIKNKMKIGRNPLKKFEKVLLDYAQELAERAIRNAKLSGRKIIKEEDI